MKKKWLNLAFVAGIFITAQTHAARPQVIIDNEAPPRSPSVVLDDSQDDNEIWNRVFGQTWVRNVTQPALYPVLPENGRGNGKAVIVVPGGGYLFVSIQNEGFRVAEALAAEGYAAFVLKYRVKPTPDDNDGFKATMFANFSQLGKKPLDEHPPAVADLASAIRHLAGNEQKYHIDSEQINVIGFSAGARTLTRLVESNDSAQLLNSVAFIYPPMDWTVKEGPRPPMFFAMATDDPLFNKDNLAFITQWMKSSTNVDVHLFSSGGHGFGFAPKGTTSDAWWLNYRSWLEKHR